MNEKQRAIWEQTRAKGMWRFVLLYGVLLWGGLMILIRLAFDFFFSGPRLLVNLMIHVPILAVTGFIFGLVLWRIGENKYRKSSGSAPSSG